MFNALMFVFKIVSGVLAFLGFTIVVKCSACAMHLFGLRTC